MLQLPTQIFYSRLSDNNVTSRNESGTAAFVSVDIRFISCPTTDAVICWKTSATVARLMARYRNRNRKQHRLLLLLPTVLALLLPVSSAANTTTVWVRSSKREYFRKIATGLYKNGINEQTDFNAPASTWVLLPPWQPAVTSTFDLQGLIRLSVGASEYSLSVLSKSFKAVMVNICPDEQ